MIKKIQNTISLIMKYPLPTLLMLLAMVTVAIFYLADGSIKWAVIYAVLAVGLIAGGIALFAKLFNPNG